MRAEELAARFAARPTADGWQVRCPAHDDRKPSLSIASGDDGRVLLHCHAGCDVETVCAAWGIETAELIPQPNGSGRCIVATYPYVDESGALLFEVVRFEPKDFRQRQPDGRGGWEWNLKGARRVLYRLDELAGADEVFVAEGEKDADALRALGFVATTVPGGAGKWRGEYREAFRAEQHVVVIPDNDDAGRAGAQTIAEALQGAVASVKMLDLPGLPAKGDVSDFIALRADPEAAAERLAIMAADAPAFEPAATPPAVTAGPKVRVRTLAEIFAEPGALDPPPIVVPRLAWAGRVSLLAAREKGGKSTLLTAASAAVSSGTHWLGDATTAGPVLWVGLEEHVSDLAGRMLHHGANPHQIHVVDSLATAADPLAAIASIACELRPALVVVDTLAALVERAAPDSGSAAAWTPLMSALTRIARDTGAAVVLSHHARKSDGSYRDSSAIGAGVDVILEMSGGSDDGVRRLKVQARWRVPDYSVRLAGRVYELAAGELSLDARVLAYVSTHVGCSQRDVESGTEGRAVNVRAAVSRLLDAGTIEDRPDARGRRLCRAEGGTQSGTQSEPEPESPGRTPDAVGTQSDAVPGHAARPDPQTLGRRHRDAVGGEVKL